MTTDAIGGVWRYTADLARSLNDTGIEVLLVCLGPRPAAEQEAEIRVLSSTRLVHLDEPLDWLVFSPEDLDAIPDRLSKLADQHSVDLLHLNLPTQAFGMTTRLPIVVVSHSCVVTWWQAMRTGALPEAWHWQAKRNQGGFAAADAVVCPSASHAGALARAYGGESRFRIVPNAVEPTPTRNAQDKSPFVLAAARWWDEGKNAGLLDEVAARLSWPVRAAGACRGPNGQHATFSHAEALDKRTASDMQALMQEAAIFVSPSLYEPFGLAALEAADGGAALVLSDIPTYREIWEGAALFSDPRDPDVFAATVESVIADPGARRDLATRAKARGRRFTPDRQLAALLGAYEAAMANRTKSSLLQPAFEA